MTNRTTALAAGAMFLVLGLPALAHHSFAAKYDANKPVTLKGTVVKMDWVNPHSWLHISVKGQDGRTVEWNCETAPPNILYRGGWRKPWITPIASVSETAKPTST